MRNLLLLMALQTSAACATLHLPPPELEAPAPLERATDEDDASRPHVLLASADVGATVSDWYVRGLLREPFDPNRPRYKAITVTGTSTLGSVITMVGGLTSPCSLKTNVDSNFLYSTCALRVQANVFSDAKFYGNVASGSNQFEVTVNGARVDFGAGASDYASSDGTTVTFAGPIATSSASDITAGHSFITSSTTGGVAVTGSGGVYQLTNKFIVNTAPTISSGFGTSPSVASNNGTAAFTINVGTGGVATSGVIGLPTAATGWVCSCTDITTASATVFLTKQTASSTTTCTVGNFNTAGAAAAWVASDILHCTAMGR